MNIVATSLKIPRPLKQRLDRLARHAHRSPHAEMLAALEQYADDAERQLAFVSDALAAEAGVLRTGKALLLDDVEAGLLARARGENPRRPRATRWPR